MVTQNESMDFGDLVEAIMDRAGPTRLVAIDGPGGAGKSTFAVQLADAAGGAPVIRTDDFASADNPINWWPRMLTEVIEPLTRGELASYQRYDWPSENLAEWHTVEPAPIVIIEGVTAGRSEWAALMSFLIWIDTPRNERLRRVVERDWSEALEDSDTWMTEEDDHYARDPTKQRADAVIEFTTTATRTLEEQTPRRYWRPPQYDYPSRRKDQVTKENKHRVEPHNQTIRADLAGPEYYSYTMSR